MKFLSSSSLFSKHGAALIGCFMLGLTFLCQARLAINHDTGWFMYAARGMLQGGQLYRDFIDVNAPLAYLTVMPAAWFSTLPFFSNEAALSFNIILFALASYLPSVSILKRVNLSPGATNFLLASLLFAMCFIEWQTFGQREHIFAMLMVPYTLAAGMRLQKRPLPTSLLITCGILAGLAISIKLPNIIVPAFIEMAVMVRRRRLMPVITPEMIALAISTTLFYIFCFTVWPEYWLDIVPTAFALYGPYDNWGFVGTALSIITPLVIVSTAVGVYRGTSPLAHMRGSLLAATLGCLALFVLQKKGWPHHALPILLFTTILLAFNLVDLPVRAIKNYRFSFFSLSAGVLAFGGILFLGVIGGSVGPDLIRDVENRIKTTDGSFYILSTGNYPAFPLALNPAYHWTSRFPQLILLPGLLAKNMERTSSPYEPAFRRAIYEDMHRGHPTTIFAFMPQDVGMPPGFRMLDWLLMDPNFEAEWNNYILDGEMPPFYVYKRKGT